VAVQLGQRGDSGCRALLRVLDILPLTQPPQRDKAPASPDRIAAYADTGLFFQQHWNVGAVEILDDGLRGRRPGWDVICAQYGRIDQRGAVGNGP
jgi:hypothetical protein